MSKFIVFVTAFFFTILFSTVARSAIVNGVETDQFPSVVAVRAGFLSCTGTAVSTTTLITAGHCATRAATFNVRKNGQTITSLHGRYAAGENLDLAVAVFPEGTFEDFSELAQESPRVGDELTLVGFGESDFIAQTGDFGTKRVGYNVLVDFATFTRKALIHNSYSGPFLHYRSPLSTENLYPGEMAMTGRGDSGGPIFVGNKLVGVVSWGQERSKILLQREIKNEKEPHDEMIYEYDTNLLADAAQTFLRKFVRDTGAAIAGLH